MGKQRRAESSRGFHVRAAEQLLIDAIGEIRGRRVLCTSVGRAQFAAALATARPDAQVCCHFLDLYHFQRAERRFQGALANLRLLCSADLPQEEFDAFVLPTMKNGETELVRDFLQSGRELLADGGRLFSATDNPRDNWLHGEMQKLFDRVTQHRESAGVLYAATKTGPLKKLKNFECDFAYRDGDRLIHVISRPGVFSHRRLDGGARALIDALQVGAGERVLDLGCGSGAVGLAAAARAEGIQVLAVDSNARAVDCTLRSAERNELQNVDALIDAEGRTGELHAFDLVLANPPYFSNHRIAEIFLEAARLALKPGGRLQLVTKGPAWFVTHMDRFFDKISTVATKNRYAVVSGVSRGA